MSNWTENDHMSPEQERVMWEDEEAARLTGNHNPTRQSFEDRLKPVLLRSLIGFWSDVDEVRQRAGINVGASPAAWRALNDLVADGLAECSGSDLQYRLTKKGHATLLIADFDLLIATGKLPDLPNHNKEPAPSSLPLHEGSGE